MGRFRILSAVLVVLGLAAMLTMPAPAEAGRANDELTDYEPAFRASWVYKDLHKVRNARPALSKFGVTLGTLYSGLDMWLNNLGLGFLVPWTFKHGHKDNEATNKAANAKPIDYPKPDGKITFDKLSSVFLSNTNHEEDQPIHLKVADEALQKSSEHDIFAGPSNRYCPAGVYEWIEEGDDAPKFQINSQNCVHCKTCDIKDPNGNITWTVPEGAGGPNYPNM